MSRDLNQLSFTFWGMACSDKNKQLLCDIKNIQFSLTLKRNPKSYLNKVIIRVTFQWEHKVGENEYDAIMRPLLMEPWHSVHNLRERKSSSYNQGYMFVSLTCQSYDLSNVNKGLIVNVKMNLGKTVSQIFNNG